MKSHGQDPRPGWFRGTSFWGRTGGGDEGLKLEGGFTFGRLQGGFKGASRGLKGGLKGASRGLHLRKASTGLQGGFKVA